MKPTLSCFDPHPGVKPSLPSNIIIIANYHAMKFFCITPTLSVVIMTCLAGGGLSNAHLPHWQLNCLPSLLRGGLGN